MKFDAHTHKFLSGRRFSNGLQITVSKHEKNIPSKMNFIEGMIKGKKIIHVGCTDHIPLIDNKIKDNIWFHKRLDEAATRCLGIDINSEAVEHCKNKLGYNDIYYHDIGNTSEPLKEIENSRWDYMIIGEVLEHIDNPVHFLKNILKCYATIEKIIITVPNALRFENFINVLKHVELINSDHRYWFTPYTLGKVAVESGMSVDGFWFVTSTEPPRLNIIKKTFMRMYPAFRDTIVMVLNTNGHFQQHK
ncbi:MAG: class I SAM-dependent methyltransferase [Thermodesulfobacteriota bacterium]